MTISMSTLVMADGAGATTAKSKVDTKSVKTLPHTPALLKAVRRIEIKKAQEYRCTKAHKWLRYQKGLRTRYAKRLTELGNSEKEAVVAHDTRKAAGLNTDIARVKARQFRNVLSKPMLKFYAHTQRVGARCELRVPRAKKRSAAAKMRAAEIRAAEIKATIGKAAKAKGATPTTPPTTSTTSTTTSPTTTPSTSSTVPSTSTTMSPGQGSSPSTTSTSSPHTSS